MCGWKDSVMKAVVAMFSGPGAARLFLEPPSYCTIVSQFIS
jgi:hypothetical protein